MGIFEKFSGRQTARGPTPTMASVAAVVDGLLVPVMLTDREMTITHVNNAAVGLLREHGEVMSALLPQVPAGTIVGTPLQLFRQQDSHGANQVLEPDELPGSSEVNVGELTFTVNVTALPCAEERHAGFMIEWHDVTEQRRQRAQNTDFQARINAISRSRAVAVFDMDGRLRDANDRFLKTMGYRLDEIQGQHQNMFLHPEHRNSAENQAFWERLNQGDFFLDEYLHVGKDGKEIWLQASYNPICGPDGQPYEVVQYATDITQQKQMVQTVQEVLKEGSRVVECLARGDLTARFRGEYDGDFGRFAASLNGSLEKLFDTIADIRVATSNIAQSSYEISQGSSDLSQRTEEQASNLEETAATMDALTGTVQQNAENARHADQLSMGARDEAHTGGQVVGRAVESMASINESSKRIADIIGVIDEIAFQTNLLALNAAVEAARAGEQGRGFAVVATEVRNLAQRSSGAAKEITTLIKDSVQRVEEGSRLVNESGETLAGIVKSVNKVSELVSEIAAASSEQSTGILQVNAAIAQMDQMTQQNAALVEESSASSESMSDEARSMSELVAFFELGTSQAVTPAHRPVAQPSSWSRQIASSATTRIAPAASAVDPDEWEEF